MQLLLIHADYLAFATTEPATEPRDEPVAREFVEALVIFTAVEQGDGAACEQVATQAADTIAAHAGTVNCQQAVLYPYAHLSENLETPAAAREVLAALAGTLAQAGLEVARVPFGWYKSFTLTCKGHPLSELSRRIVPTTTESALPITESASLSAESELRSNFFILDPDGTLTPAADAKLDRGSALAQLVGYETAKERAAQKEPPHIRLMQQLELVDREPGSDAGNLRWYPKGLLIKRLLEAKIEALCHRAGAMEVETPEMYDYDHPCLKKYLQRFPARQYQVLSGQKPYFLRFAACFGQFLIARDAQISYRHLPLRLYELAHSSYRREKSGELAGLRRLRGFTMPDMHALVADLPMGLDEMQFQFDLSMEWMESLGVPYEAAMRVQSDFFAENRAFYQQLAARLERPMLLELFEQRYAYFITKFEFNFIDTQHKAAALSTVQIDVENAHTFEIDYIDADGTAQRPYLTHASISGSIDRNVYALLEHAAATMARGANAPLPFWLAPTQLRLLPVATAHHDACLALAGRLAAATGCRIDVDDREQGVGRKIRDGEKEWIPLLAVYGDREVETGELAVRIRGGEQETFTEADLAARLSQQQGGEPQRALPLPVRVSRRPRFYG